MSNGTSPASVASRALLLAGPAALAVLALLAAWEIYVALAGISPLILPPPSRILAQVFEQRHVLAGHSWATLQAAVLGFALSLMAAFLLSIVIDFFPCARRAILPVLIVTQTLPLVAIAPLVVLWFGFGLVPKILLVALVTFFPMLVAWARGYEATEAEIQLLVRSMGASRVKLFLVARLPSALPYFFAGLRVSITYAVVGAIFAEYAGAARGLGIFMLNAKNNFRPDLVLAAVLVSAVLTLVLFGLAVLCERATMPWTRLSDRRP